MNKVTETYSTTFPNGIPASLMMEEGIKCSTVGKSGGIGFAYILPDKYWKKGKPPSKIAWRSAGNGFYTPEEYEEIHVDNGDLYMNRVRLMMTPWSR